MKYMEACLYEFINKMEVDPLNAYLWSSLVREEKEELLKEGVDLLYVLMGLRITQQNLGNSSSADLSGQVIKSVHESLSNIFGPDELAIAFDRVHKSNMSKLDDDGKPIRREDGKVLKGPNYQPAELGDLV